MRLKLVFISAFVAAILGAGSASAIIISATSSLNGLTRPGLLVISSNLLPLLAILFTSIFVYRHTARRRKLQAILTAILAILLTILFFVIASVVTARRQPVQPDSPPPVAPAFRL
jgi:amino acid transporter